MTLLSEGNGLLSGGRMSGWTLHGLQHPIGAYHDIIHGEGLAILTPFWMDHVLSDATAPKFAEYGVNVWGLAPSDDVMALARQAIQCTRDFFRRMNLPATLREVGIDEANFDIMAEKAAPRCAAAYVPLSKEDILAIFKAAL